ncbi:hypothetical protein NFI96_014644 [Prochilodus magdalenae]|nr:hypothetical protein NFI96_014644 [Prochilodus magdalenae]
MKRNEVRQSERGEKEGTSIVQVTATDADDPTYGNSARLVYTLVQGQPHFSVDPQTGQPLCSTFHSAFSPTPFHPLTSG